jgi:hypothetical protein
LALVVSCSQNAQLTAVAITPASVTFEANIPAPDFVPTNETAQLTATGTYENGKNGTVTYQNITDQVVWSSSLTTVATVDASGLVTPTGCGSTSINAAGGNGGLVSSILVTVCNLSGISGSMGSLSSLKVAAPPQTLSNRGEKAQYVAFGTYAAGATRDMTATVKWSTSDPRMATVDSNGLVTLAASCSNIGSGPAVTVTAAVPGSAFTASASFLVGSCGSGREPALAVHEAGEGAGKVVSNAGSIKCSGGEGCTGNFALNAPVMLTATPNPGSVFGGFSASCAPVTPDPSGCLASQRGSDVKSCTCVTTAPNSGAVGAIFNPASQ